MRRLLLLGLLVSLLPSCAGRGKLGVDPFLNQPPCTVATSQPGSIFSTKVCITFRRA